MKPLLLENVLLIDGTGRPPYKAAIRIDGSRFASVSAAAKSPAPEKFDVLDLAGLFALPGLIDCHVHLVSPVEPLAHEPYWKLNTPPTLKAFCAARNALETLKAGFTTVRNCGGVSYGLPEDIFLRKAIAAGYLIGPRILACGGGISMTGGHGDRQFPVFMPAHPHLGYGDETCDDPGSCRREVRRKVKMGADFIKAYTSGGVSTPGDGPQSAEFTAEEIRAIVEEAHAHEKRVAVHAYGLQGIRNAVDAGVDTVEHGCYLNEATARRMAQQGTSLVTTLGILKAILRRGQSYPNPEALKKAETVVAAQSSAFGIARSAGVNMAMGTDASVSIRNGDNAVELIELTGEGLSPLEALMMATRNAAIALGLENEIGTVEPGKSADLLLLDENPLEDISVIAGKRAIRAVIRNGQLLCARNENGEELLGSPLPLETAIRAVRSRRRPI
ncbi:MAG: amidohydrolase family protein [Desulfobacterales bacterium]|jgi:imidazolonepropionase-like amidohydrolase|nr:amidohydrolase family protein [Desulfobacterales bacterium]